MKAAQYLLSARGYETRADVDFGSGAAARAKSFQGSVGLQGRRSGALFVRHRRS